MHSLPVVTHPNDILRTVSEPISDADLLDPKTQEMIDDLIETMNVENGIGIAAPQVGEHVRIVIIETKNGPEVFVNPKIISRSERMVKSEEGCLSVPGVHGFVERHKTVKVKAKNRDGEPLRVKADHMISIVLHHEIDHLDGILFIDKAYKIIKGDSDSAI